MSDWTDTLNARQQGYMAGFLAADLPLEEQDQELGGPRAVTADVEADDDALDAMSKAELLEEAGRRGIEVDRSATKAQLVEMLRGA